MHTRGSIIGLVIAIIVALVGVGAVAVVTMSGDGVDDVTWNHFPSNSNFAVQVDMDSIMQLDVVKEQLASPDASNSEELTKMRALGIGPENWVSIYIAGEAQIGNEEPDVLMAARFKHDLNEKDLLASMKEEMGEVPVELVGGKTVYGLEVEGDTGKVALCLVEPNMALVGTRELVMQAAAGKSSGISGDLASLLGRGLDSGDVAAAVLIDEGMRKSMKEQGGDQGGMFPVDGLRDLLLSMDFPSGGLEVLLQIGTDSEESARQVESLMNMGIAFAAGMGGLTSDDYSIGTSGSTVEVTVKLSSEKLAKLSETASGMSESLNQE